MDQERQLVFLANVPFEVFGSEGKLKEYGREENVVDLLAMTKVQGSYDFIFNKLTRQPELFPVGENVHHYEHITLPSDTVNADVELEPWKRGKLNQFSRERDWGVYYADSFMRRTLQGLPTEYEFHGTVFTQDVYRELLYESANPENVIRLDDVPSSPHGYEIYYDDSVKNVRPPDHPLQTELIFLDQMVSSDPLNMAKKFGISIGRLPEYDEMLRSKVTLEHCRTFTGNLPEPLSSQELGTEQSRVEKGSLPENRKVKRISKKGLKR